MAIFYGILLYLCYFVIFKHDELGKNIYLDTYFTKVIIVVVVDTCMILKKEGIPRYIDFLCKILQTGKSGL